MMNQYKQITKILVWIVVISTSAYFILLPVSFTRPNPSRVSPQKINLQANPFQIIATSAPFEAQEIKPYEIETATSQTSTLELPKPLMQIGE